MKLPDRKEWNNGIETVIIDLLEKNKSQYFSLEEMTKRLQETQPWIWDYRCILHFGLEVGLPSRIASVIHSLKERGYPILSSAIKGQGYTIPEPTDSDVDKIWDSKLLANESQRFEIPEQEKRNDAKLLREFIKTVIDPVIRNNLIKVAIKHNINLEEKE